MNEFMNFRDSVLDFAQLFSSSKSGKRCLPNSTIGPGGEDD